MWREQSWAGRATASWEEVPASEPGSCCRQRGRCRWASGQTSLSWQEADTKPFPTPPCKGTCQTWPVSWDGEMLGVGKCALHYMKPPELLPRTLGGASADTGERAALSWWQPQSGLCSWDSPIPAQPVPQSPGHVRHQMLLPKARIDAETKRAAQDSWSDSEMNPRQQRWCFPAPQAQCFETRGQLYLHSLTRGRGCSTTELPCLPSSVAAL